MIPAKRFYMIRHGETEANASRTMAGSIDSPLTVTGRAQAEKVAKAIVTLEPKPSVIIHSHLSRARDTATIINRALNLDMHEDPDFAEIHAGDWEGTSYKICRAFLHSFDDPPNGETYDEFIDRIKRGKNTYMTKHNSPVLIVCHGGVFRAFGKIYGLNMPGVQNCHLYEFEPRDHPIFPWKVWQHNIDENNTLLRSPAQVYDDALADAMAS